MREPGSAGPLHGMGQSVAQGEPDLPPLPKLSYKELVRQARDLEIEIDDFPEERVDILGEAAECWQEAGELDEAERCLRLAAAEPPEPARIDPRVFYAEFLLQYRDKAQGQALLDAIWRDRSVDPGTYHYIAELFEAFEDHERALEWANAGLARCYPPPFDPDIDDLRQDLPLHMLISARSRVRESLGQPRDELDELSERVREDFRAMLEQADSSAPPTMVVAHLYWPPNEFEQVMARWPDLYPDWAGHPEAHGAHRREVERALRQETGHSVLLAAGDADGFAEFCAAEGLDPSSGGSSARYAARLAMMDQAASWPPGRNEPCWCGSSRKYKKCCGAPGFVD